MPSPLPPPDDTDAPSDPEYPEDLAPAPSLMERVAQNQSLLQDAAQRTQSVAQNGLLDTQQVQQHRLALAQLAGAQNVNAARAAADVAVTDSTYQAAHDDATWREANAADLASARADLPGVLDAINTETDPFRLRDAAITFHGRYAHLTQDPVLGDQYKALDGRVAARLQARDEEFRARIATAAAGFRPLIDPAFPERLADIRNSPYYPLARLDPNFAQQIDDATRQSAALAKQAQQTQADAAAQARPLQVDGYDGQAPTPQDARWFTALHAATARIEDSAARLQNIASTSNGTLSPIDQTNARSLAERLRDNLSPQLFGPDVVSETDRQLLADTINHPARVLDAGSREALQRLVGRVQQHRMIDADSLGLRPAPAPATTVPTATAPTTDAPAGNQQKVPAPAGKQDSAPSAATDTAGANPTHIPNGIPYGGTFNTPFGPMTVPNPPGYRPSASDYAPEWLVKWLTPKPHPELDQISEVLAKGGRWVDPNEVRKTPQISDPAAYRDSKKTVEFKKPFIITMRDGLIYSVLDGADKQRTASPKDVGLDGVYPSNDILRGSPTDEVRKAKGRKAGLDVVNGLLGGQVKAMNQLHRFAFVYDRADHNWYINDISNPTKPGLLLPESQAKEILGAIYEHYGLPRPDFKK